jgi:toxin FitB
VYLLDTCVLAEARRRSPEAGAWLVSVARAALPLSVMTLGEIMKGIALIGRRDPTAAASLARWLEELRAEYEGRILAVDDAVGIAWGRLMAIRPRPFTDGLIAATAIIHSKIVVTRNVADFADAGVQIINPWAL